jgi:hypothetical protein
METDALHVANMSHRGVKTAITDTTNEEFVTFLYQKACHFWFRLTNQATNAGQS